MRREKKLIYLWASGAGRLFARASHGSCLFMSCVARTLWPFIFKLRGPLGPLARSLIQTWKHDRLQWLLTYIDLKTPVNHHALQWHSRIGSLLPIAQDRYIWKELTCGFNCCHVACHLNESSTQIVFLQNLGQISPLWNFALEGSRSHVWCRVPWKPCLRDLSQPALSCFGNLGGSRHATLGGIKSYLFFPNSVS